jgi:hypothetical protein
MGGLTVRAWLLGGWLTGVRCHVAEYLGDVCAFGVQGRVGVVFGDAPDAVALIPEGGPPRVLLEEAGELRGCAGRGEGGHGFCLTRGAISS